MARVRRVGERAVIVVDNRAVRAVRDGDLAGSRICGVDAVRAKPVVAEQTCDNGRAGDGWTVGVIMRHWHIIVDADNEGPADCIAIGIRRGEVE